MWELKLLRLTALLTTQRALLRGSSFCGAVSRQAVSRPSVSQGFVSATAVDNILGPSLDLFNTFKQQLCYKMI